MTLRSVDMVDMERPEPVFLNLVKRIAGGDRCDDRDLIAQLLQTATKVEHDVFRAAHLQGLNRNRYSRIPAQRCLN